MICKPQLTSAIPGPRLASLQDNLLVQYYTLLVNLTHYADELNFVLASKSFHALLSWLIRVFSQFSQQNGEPGSDREQIGKFCLPRLSSFAHDHFQEPSLLTQNRPRRLCLR